MLQKGQLIPPLSLHTPGGRVVHAWDHKQKKNLVIAFLDGDCVACEEFLRALAASAVDLLEREALALVVFLAQPPQRITDSLPAEVVVGTDMPGRSSGAFLGSDAFSSRGYVRGGVFVTDRYGEVSATWAIEHHKFPTVKEIMLALDYVQLACDECRAPLWRPE